MRFPKVLSDDRAGTASVPNQASSSGCARCRRRTSPWRTPRPVLLAPAPGAGATGVRYSDAFSTCRACRLANLESSRNVPEGFWPNVDGVVIPRQIFASFRDGLHHKVPIIVGSNADEGYNYSKTDHLLDLFQRFPSPSWI